MQSKLQELTDKLYNEGLSKGKKEGEAIVTQAQSQAEQIVAEAKAEAEKILAEAEKKAEELRSRTDSDVKMAANQTLAATKQAIEKILVAKVADAEISKALTSAAFVKEVITAVAQAFKAESSGPADLEVVLPESLKKEMEPFLRKELATALKAKVEGSFSRKLTGGFTIGPKDGGWFVSFTDETFQELISAYLRPATKKILFGE